MLNPWQRRAVSVTLHLVEETVARIERLLAMPPAGVVHAMADDLPPEARQQISVLCRKAREAVAHVADEVHAEVAERSLCGTIRGDVATLWATLEDTKSEALRGYGALSPEDGAVVDELLDGISRHIAAIFRLVETAQDDGAARAARAAKIAQTQRG